MENDYFYMGVFVLVMVTVGALVWLVQRAQARASREEAERRRVELRDNYYAEQLARQTEWQRAQQARRAAQREQANKPDKRELERQRNEEARRRLDKVAIRRKRDDTSTPGQPLYDGSVHAINAGEVPRSISGLSDTGSHCGSSDYGVSYSGGSDSGSADSGSADSGGSCGGGD